MPYSQVAKVEEDIAEQCSIASGHVGIPLPSSGQAIERLPSHLMVRVGKRLTPALSESR